MIIANVNNKIDIITATLDSTPLKDKYCVAHNRKNNQVFVITAEENLDTVKIYSPVIEVKTFDAQKRNEIWNSDDYVYSGRLDFLNYNPTN